MAFENVIMPGFDGGACAGGIYYTGLEERWQPRGAAVLEQPAVAFFAAAVAFRCISFHFQLPP